MFDGLLNGAQAGSLLPPAPQKPGGVLMLKLWAALLHSEGLLDPKLLSSLGAGVEVLEQLAAEHTQELEYLRWLRFTGRMFTRAALLELLRARYAEQLMNSSKPSEILALTKAMERMSQWMWQEDSGNADEGGATAENEGKTWFEMFPGESSPDPDGHAALELLHEMLTSKYDETSQEQITDMLMRAEALSARLEEKTYGPAPGMRAYPRKPSCTKKRARTRR